MCSTYCELLKKLVTSFSIINIKQIPNFSWSFIPEYYFAKSHPRRYELILVNVLIRRANLYCVWKNRLQIKSIFKFHV